MITKPIALRTLISKTAIVHTVTYFGVGLVASTLFNYAELFARPEVAVMMRPIDDPMVMTGPLLQPLRGLIFAVALYPIQTSIFHRPRGWAVLWGLFVALGILGTFGPAPGSLEGLIYTRYTLDYHFSHGMLEVLSQSLLLSALLYYWVQHPTKKWLNWTLWGSFAIVLLLPAMGLLALAAGIV